MFLHEYLKILYDYCGGGVPTAEFVRDLFESSMSSFGKPDLFPDDSLPQKLFNGNSKLSKQLAGKVRINLDQDCFIGCIDKAAADARQAFMEAFGADPSMDEDEFQERLFLQFRLFIDNPGKEVANIIGEDIKKAPPHGERSAEAQRKYDETVGRYLASARNYYSRIKTLLYDKESKDFNSFYVCNDLEHHSNRKSAVTVSSVTAQKLMEISQFIIITGTGGLGKSMMMSHLLLDAIESYVSGKKIPVFIPLKNFDQSPAGMADYIYDTMQGLCPALSREMFDYALQSGDLLILFDGLDEVRQKDLPRFDRGVERLTNQYPQNGFVISSRPFSEFVSFQQFCVLELLPFTKEQAVQLIQKLEFYPDEPEIKGRFLNALDKTLYTTHRSFAQNPLLLTLMLLTFSRFAEVPSKMHIFYREAFLTLFISHDAAKRSAFKRELKTGLDIDAVEKYIAEICFRSYRDEKYDFTQDEFSAYFAKLPITGKTISARDFLDDLRYGLCIVYFEGGKYRFLHRSFQEYFAAVFMSRQTEEFLGRLGGFFERRYSNAVFPMLYDIVPEKVEAFVFVPYLTSLLARCDAGDGYWTFLEEMYPIISYTDGEVEDWDDNEPESYMFEFILKQLDTDYRLYVGHLPFYESLVTEEVKGYMGPLAVETKNGDTAVFEWPYYEMDEDEEPPEPEIIGYKLEFDVAKVRQRPEKYAELLATLDDNSFIFKCEYNAARVYLDMLRDKMRERSDDLNDLL